MKKIVLLIITFFAYTGYAFESFDATTASLFVDVSVEAEAGTRNRGATTQSCGSCSGGEHVGDLGGLPENAPNAYLASVVSVATAGKYSMSLRASSGATRSIFISVNGATEAAEVVVNSGDWSTPATYVLVLDLAQGTNTIKFFNDISYAPNIDKYDLTLLEAESTCNNCFGPFEAEAGVINAPATIQSCGECSGGQQVGDMGYSDRFFTYDVTTTIAGTYRMYLSYISGSTRRLTVTVNGSTDYSNSFNSVDWNVVYVKEIDIVLSAGVNTLKFHNPENNLPFGGGDDQWAPNVDKFRLELMVNWDGSEGTDWATAGNWDTNFIPTAGDNVVIPTVSNLPIISGATNAAARDLNVNSSLTINSGGSLIVNGTSTGNVTYKRNLGTTNWYLMSSPVSGVSFNNDFVTANNIATGIGNNRGVASYITTSDSWNYLQFGGNVNSIAGVGYSVKQSIASDVSFTGTINTSSVSVATSTGGNGGFNLIGNPYTSHVNSATFLTDNTANLVSQTIWVWNQETSNYETKVTGDSFVLAPTQGFFVRASTGTNLNIAESYQTSTGGTFQKTSNTEVKLMMNDGSNNRFAKMYYLDNATKGFDNGFDGETFGGIENTVDVFTNLVANNEGKKYQVQSLPLAEMETMIVPLGVKAAAGKEITFTAEALNLPNDLKVFLEDRLTNTFTRLDEANSSYKVTLNDALNGTGRFFLHTKASGVLSTDEVVLQNTSVYAINNNTLRVVGLPSGNANVKMYTILGKQVMSTSFSSTGVKDISLPKLSTGMYIIQLETAAGKLNKKIVLE